MPRVSILLTCFNHMQYLPAAMKSIQEQTFSDYEIIALDDGSTDGSREWLEGCGYESRLVFHERNVGTYASLNIGISTAKGGYIAILNDDDLWAPTKLEKQVSFLDKNPKSGLVHTGGGFVDSSGSALKSTPLGFEFNGIQSGNALLSLIYFNKIIASGVLIRRECFDRLGGFTENLYGSGDWEMWLRIAEQFEMGFVKEPLTFYRWHESNASRNLEKVWADDVAIRTWLSARFESYRLSGIPTSDLMDVEAHNWACLGTAKTLLGDRSGGRKAYAESIKLAPRRFKTYARWISTFFPSGVLRRMS